MSSGQPVYVQKRRSTRIYNTIPLAIQGSDAFRAPYLDHVSTLTVNCHGCRYQSKYEVIPGDTVYLDVKRRNGSGATYSCQARVKWVQRLLTKDSGFEIAVELTAPGNIWGIVAAPEDWFPIQAPKAIEQGSAPQEQPLATRSEQQVAPAPHEQLLRPVHLEREDAAAGLAPLFGQLMAGFGEQIQIMVSQAATAAFVNERERLLGEFRAQLQDEAARTLECVLSATKEELTGRIRKELNEAHEAAAQIACERWNGKIERDMKNVAQHMLTQATKVTQRVEGITSGAIERLQRNMEASRNEAVDRFLNRLREQLTPLLDDAKVTLQNLTASEKKCRDESQAMREQFEHFLQQATQSSIAEVREKTVGMLEQFESDVTKRLAASHEGLQETSAEAIAETNRKLRELSQSCEETIQSQMRSHVSSAADFVTSVLNERSAEISRQFSKQLEGSTRDYLESISKSIAQIPENTAMPSGD